MTLGGCSRFAVTDLNPPLLTATRRNPLRSADCRLSMTDSARSHSPDALLHPECEPHASGMLALDARHTMYWESCGNPDGAPLLFLHGGPGGGSLPHHRRFHDPRHWRIVLYDQRGAGRSTPVAAPRLVGQEGLGAARLKTCLSVTLALVARVHACL